MYKKRKHHQESFFDFNQGFGIPIDENNRWAKLAKDIPWDDLEDEYSSTLSKDKGAPAVSFRTMLGALIIQNVYGLSDRSVTKEIQENAYLQYFLGFERFNPSDRPFDPSMLVRFRKRLTGDLLKECNEIYIDSKKKFLPEQTDHKNTLKQFDDKKNEIAKYIAQGIILGAQNRKDALRIGHFENIGQIITDASCCPVNITYPTDTNLLNTARIKVQDVVHKLCKKYKLKKPRMYKRKAQNKYLTFAKAKNPKKDTIRSMIKYELNCVRRNMNRFEELVQQGALPNRQQLDIVMTAKAIYDQQKTMYDNNVNRIENRIVSFHMPFIRPIKRGKKPVETEFGPKIDISVDEDGYTFLEHLSFDNYNESKNLKSIIERYRERTGNYPESVLVDKIYWTNENRDYCSKRNIRISATKRGKKFSDPEKQKKYEKTLKKDLNHRTSVERHFSREKLCFGIEKLKTKLPETIACCISLAIFLDNIIPTGF